MCTQQAGRVAMGVSTFGLSEAIRPALSKSNQGLMDNIGSLGAAPALASMTPKETPYNPLAIKSPAAQKAIINSYANSSNPTTNTGVIAV